MTDTRRMHCGNDPRALLSPGDCEAVEDFKAWLKARQDGTLGEQFRAAADKLRPSSRSVAVVLPPAIADAVAELLTCYARAPVGSVAIPYEAFLLARRLLGEQP